VKTYSLFKVEYKWFLVIILLLGSIINYLDRANLSIANTTIASEFHLNAFQMGLILSAFMWPYAIANLPAGWLIDKIGIHKIFLASVLLWSFATLLGGISHTFEMLYISRVILGIAEAPFFIIAAKVCQLYFEETRRGFTVSLINTGPKIAQGFAPIFLAALMITYNWQTMFFILSFLSLFIILLWLLFYRKDLPQTLIKTPPLKTKISWGRLIHTRSSWLFNIGNFTSSYIFWFYFTWLTTYLIKNKHMSIEKSAWLTSVPFIVGIFAVPLGGWISDTLIKKGVNPIKARVLPASLGCLISGIAVLPVNYIHSETLSMTLITLSFFFLVMRVGVLWALVTDIVPKQAVGTFGGIQNFFNFLGGTLAPICTGYILVVTQNNYNLAFIVCGVMALISALAYGLIKKPIVIE